MYQLANPPHRIYNAMTAKFAPCIRRVLNSQDCHPCSSPRCHQIYWPSSPVPALGTSTHVLIIISCCSTEAFPAFVIFPKGRSFAWGTGNEPCNNLQYIQTGRTSSCAHTPQVLSYWTALPTFPCSHLPSWTTAESGSAGQLK
jgi:hypothetical protein